MATNQTATSKALPPLDSELHAVLRALIEVSAPNKIAEYLSTPTPACLFKANQLNEIVTWARGLS